MLAHCNSGFGRRKLIMQGPTNTAITQKARELCQIITEQPEFQDIRQQVDSFFADPQSQAQYQSLSEKGHALHHKQQHGIALDAEEITAFEQEREGLLANPTAKAFILAQEQMHRIQESVNEYINKTFELGRVPTEADFHNCCSDGSCCGHEQTKSENCCDSGCCEK
jgi:cell fate (sporulation/competence/biofilm development) regulator YlbF (YheA/YmcA/DUF963 family)